MKHSIEDQIKQNEESISHIPTILALLQDVLENHKKKVIETEKAIENAKGFKSILEEELIRLRKSLNKE